MTPDEPSDLENSVVEHLTELRDRLFKAFLAIFVCLCVLAVFPGPAALYDLLAVPVLSSLPKGSALIATSVISPFIVPLKILLICSFFLALPAILWQAWAFVAPGLYEHEKKLAFPLVASSTVLFYAGTAFCYFFVFGQVFTFIQSFAPKSIVAAPDIEAYLDFCISMFMAFGFTFEVPVAIVVIVHFNIVSLAALCAFRGYFIVLSFIAAAILTPPDVVSQLALAIPMCILYEVGLFAAPFFIARTQAQSVNHHELD